MFCGMNFTTTGIEFGRSEPNVLRYEYRKPLTAPMPPPEQLASRGPNIASKATQAGEGLLLAPQVEQKDEGQDSSAKPKKPGKGITGEDSESLSSSATSSSPSWSSSSPSTSPTRPSAAELSEAVGGPNADARSGPPLPSTSSLNGQSPLHDVNKGDASNAAVGGRNASKRSKPSANRKGYQAPNGSQPVNDTVTKGPPQKRVRFASGVQERVISPDPEPLSETSSSDGSDCSYTDPNLVYEAGRAFTGRSDPAKVPKPRTAGLDPTTTNHWPARYLSMKPKIAVPSSSEGPLAVSKWQSRATRSDQIIVLESGSKEVVLRKPSDRSLPAIKTALRDPSLEHRSLAFSDNKENDLQYDERLGLAVREV